MKLKKAFQPQFFQITCRLGGADARRLLNFHTTEPPILLRRLRELDTPEADSWADDIAAAQSEGEAE